MFGAWNFLSIRKRGLKGQNVDFELVNESTNKNVVLNNKPIGCLYETLDLPAGHAIKHAIGGINRYNTPHE